MTIYYSASSNSFYPDEFKSRYEKSNTWPADAVIVSDEIFKEYSGQPAAGKIRSPASDGMPEWVDTAVVIDHKAVRDSKLEQLVHDFGDGRVMQVRKSDEQNIRNAMEIMQRHGLSVYGWFMADNTMHDVTLAELQAALESGQDQAAVVWQEFFSNV